MRSVAGVSASIHRRSVSRSHVRYYLWSGSVRETRMNEVTEHCAKCSATGASRGARVRGHQASHDREFANGRLDVWWIGVVTV
jgi:hypothetical protein